MHSPPHRRLFFTHPSLELTQPFISFKNDLENIYVGANDRFPMLCLSSPLRPTFRTTTKSANSTLSSLETESINAQPNQDRNTVLSPLPLESIESLVEGGAPRRT